jgi:RimJ/RimL family protein N-acetyltransferase
VFDFNPRARHVYEKAGFVHEGTKRDALRWDGKWIDCHCMALLDRDWEKVEPGT